jgi:hypothetical protein
MGRADQKVLTYLGSSDGVITRGTALALGMPSTTLKEWVRCGRLVKVGSGLYVLPGVLRDERTTLGAATAALNAVVSHGSAARLHRLDGLDPRRIDVTVPVRRSNRFEGVTVHQSTDLFENEITTIDGLPVTDCERTIVDLAAKLPPRLLAAVLDQAVRVKMTTYESVASRLELTARQGKPGVTKLRRVLEPRLGGSFVSESTLETMALALIEDAGLPLPSTQYRPQWLRKVNGRVDLAYADQEVLIECDSLRWHGTPEAVQLDRHRDNLAQLAGWISFRFTYADFKNRPSYVVGTIRAALSRRSGGGIPPPEH